MPAESSLRPPPWRRPATLSRVYIVFAARTGSWRSIFAVHSWIVVKPRNGQYTRYEVTGFGEPVRINRIAPDAYWFSYYPEIVGDIRGELAGTNHPEDRRRGPSIRLCQAR